MKTRLFPLIALVSLWLFVAGCAGSGGSSSGPSDPPGEFKMSIVRIADLDTSVRSAFTGFGTDTLSRGRLEIEDEVEFEEDGGKMSSESHHEIEVKLKGAPSDATYDVTFCNFATGTTNCVAVGQVRSSHDGGENKNMLNIPTGLYAGVFVFSRTINGTSTPEFVTGFNTTAQGRDEESDDDNPGFRSGLQPVSLITPALSATKLPAAGQDNLLTGSRVRVPQGTQVTSQLVGTAASATYAVEFCPFSAAATAGSTCTAIGNITTDAQGNASVNNLTFPNAGVFAGVFVLTRTINGAPASEFITGFSRQ